MLTKKIIFDTDIGDDIDDAFALALLANVQNADIIGVTTVFRNTKCRAQQASHLLKVMGKDIPVYAGERLPIKETIHPFASDNKEIPLDNQPTCQWCEDYDCYPVNNGAVDFIIESAEKYGEDLLIIAVGPLTNVARAIEKAPEIMKKTGRVMQMGGWFTNYEPEWNVFCDPEATHIVWSFGIPVYAVGLDVTLQCALEKNLMQDFKNSLKPANKTLSLWMDRWFDFFNFDKSVMHDPLAVVTCFERVCTFEQKVVKVNLSDKRGAIICPADKESGCTVFVATAVDKDKFYSTVRKVLL